MNHPIQPHKMSNSHLASPEPSDNCDVTSSFDTQPRCCDCQNQLAHWNWAGVLHEDLPKVCKQTMGIDIKNAPTSDRTGKLISDGLQSGN